MMRRTIKLYLGFALPVLLCAGCAQSQVAPGSTVQPEAATVAPTQSSRVQQEVIVAMTTSIQDSGLLDVLVPVFEKNTGYKVKPVAVGSGQALALAAKGEADVLFICAPEAEREALAQGSIVDRRLVMHDNFIIVGPAADPAGIKGKPVNEAMGLISKGQALFISRGDDSGTHKKERSLWVKAAIKPEGGWYQEVGAGMGKALQIADERQGYTLSDSATFLMQKQRSTQLSLVALVEEDTPQMLNLYSVMAVNPAQFSKVNYDGARAFSTFLLSAEGQALITSLGKDLFPQPLFIIDGGKSDKDYGL